MRTNKSSYSLSITCKQQDFIFNMLLQFRWLEHSTDNRKVAGSIPAKSTSKRDSGSNPALGPVVQLGQNALTPNLAVNGPYARDIRQQFSLARTRDLGSRGRGFKSLLPDHKDVYSKPSFRRLWVRAPRKAPLAFLAELVYAFDLKSNYSMMRLVYIGDCCNGSKTGFDPDSGGPTPSSPARAELSVPQPLNRAEEQRHAQQIVEYVRRPL